MAVDLFTQNEVAGTSLSPAHGTEGNMSRLNEIIALANANEAQVALNTAALAGASNPFNFAGTVAAAADFPTVAAVTAGDTYVATADVLDNDATKTNTGLNFLAGSVLTWDGTTWQDGDTDETGIYAMTATPYAVTDGVHTVLVDTTAIGAPSVVNLPALAAARKGRTVTVIDVSAGAATFPISVTPQGADEIDNVAAAKDIDKNDAALAVFTEGTEWWTLPSAASLAVHEAVTASAHGKVAGITIGIDMAPGGAPVNNAITLNGQAAAQFLPKEVVFVCSAGAALAGDVTVSLGTTPGGVEISAPFQLVGLTTAGQVYRVVLAGLLPEIAGNAALDCTVTIADTGGGATGTMTAYIIGEEV